MSRRVFILLGERLQNVLESATRFFYAENWRDGVVVRASALRSVDLGFICQVESYQKTLQKKVVFTASLLSLLGYKQLPCAKQCGEQAGELACGVPGQGT